MGGRYGGKLGSEGPSYVVSITHSVLVTFWAFYNISGLWSADIIGKSIVDPALPQFAAGQATMHSFYPFLAYLANDLLHIAFPRLGTWSAGWDSVAHHIGFLALGTATLGHGIYPFPACWLLLGELSSIPLLSRFFLISTGRGDSVAMAVANATFAFFFFCMRVVVYWAGILHTSRHLTPVLLAPPRNGPVAVIRSLEGGVFL